ncbi:DUF1127 domain-containing protein [Roseiarcus sp.]|uniref:DUF1127 domain-containing protein n=1 Tax=Roseiarcus sp. TaxID=1969460 RepID=UPI003F95E8F1
MSSESRPLAVLAGFLARAAAWPFRVAEARATLSALAGMDRRELADIGLTPGDLRDVSALALDRDPTALLARRARERRRDAFAPPTAPSGDWNRAGMGQDANGPAQGDFLLPVERVSRAS